MKQTGIKIWLAIVIILAPLAHYSFGQRGLVSLEAEVGARAYADTMSMCKALLDQRLPKIPQLDEATQNHGHLPVLALALSDGGFRAGLSGLADYSIAFGKAAQVSGDALAAGILMDETNRIIQTRSYKLKVLLGSPGYKKAIEQCAAKNNVITEDLDQLMRSVLGDIDTSVLVSSRVATFLATGYAFNKALSLVSKGLGLGCDHWFNTRRGLITAGVGAGLIGGSIGYGMIVNDQMKQAADEINEAGVGRLIDSMTETRVSADLSGNVKAYLELVDAYNAFYANQTSEVGQENIPPELISQLDIYMAKRPDIEQQLNELKSLGTLTPEESQYVVAAQSLIRVISMHEDFWRLWLQENKDKQELVDRQMLLEAIFEHQKILMIPEAEMTSSDFEKLSVLREQISNFDYNKAN